MWCVWTVHTHRHAQTQDFFFVMVIKHTYTQLKPDNLWKRQSFMTIIFFLFSLKIQTLKFSKSIYGQHTFSGTHTYREISVIIRNTHTHTHSMCIFSISFYFILYLFLSLCGRLKSARIVDILWHFIGSSSYWPYATYIDL